MPDRSTPRYGDLIETSIGSDPAVRGRVVALQPLVISLPGAERIEVTGKWVTSTFPTHVQRTTDGLVTGQMVKLSSHLVTSSIHLRGWIEEVLSPVSLRLSIRTDAGLRSETVRLTKDVWITEVPQDTSAWLATVPCGVFGPLLATTHVLIEDEGVRVYRDGFEIAEGCVQQCRGGDELRIMTRVGKRLDTQTFSASEGYRWATLPADQSQYLRQQIKRPLLQLTKTVEPAEPVPQESEEDVQVLRQRHHAERQSAAERRAFRQELLSEVAGGMRALMAKKARQEASQVVEGTLQLPDELERIDVLSIATGEVVSSGVARNVYPDFVWLQETSGSWSRFSWSSYTWRKHVEVKEGQDQPSVSAYVLRRPLQVPPAIGQRIDVLRAGTDEVLRAGVTVDSVDQWSVRCGPNTFNWRETWWRPAAEAVPVAAPVLPPDPARLRKVRRRWAYLSVGVMSAAGATVSLTASDVFPVVGSAMLGLTIAIVHWSRSPADSKGSAPQLLAEPASSTEPAAALKQASSADSEPIHEDSLDAADRDQVQALRRRMDVILQRSDLSTMLRVEVQRMKAEHLRTAVRDYLQLKDSPRASTQAREIFEEQLGLIETGVVRAEDVVAEQLLRRQQEHRNYLRDVLGQSSLDLDKKDGSA